MDDIIDLVSSDCESSQPRRSKRLCVQLSFPKVATHEVFSGVSFSPLKNSPHKVSPVLPTVATREAQEATVFRHESHAAIVTKKATVDTRATSPVQPQVRAVSQANPPDDPSLLGNWKDLESQLRCDICKSIMDVPVSLSKCFHAFCSFCIRRYLELGVNGSVCPCCRVPASNTDIRLEPRIAGIIEVLKRENFRKKLRANLRNDTTCIQHISNNETFKRQTQLAILFATGGTPVGRSVFPVYSKLKEKDIVNLCKSDGILNNASTHTHDSLVRCHKEFILHLQAAHDAGKMNMYPLHPPTREGIAKLYCLQNRSLFTHKKPPSETVARLTRDANIAMQQRLAAHMHKRRTHA